MLNYLTRVVATPMNIIMTSLDDAGISILQPIPFVSVARTKFYIYGETRALICR